MHNCNEPARSPFVLPNPHFSCRRATVSANSVLWLYHFGPVIGIYIELSSTNLLNAIKYSWANSVHRTSKSMHGTQFWMHFEHTVHTIHTLSTPIKKNCKVCTMCIQCDQSALLTNMCVSSVHLFYQVALPDSRLPPNGVWPAGRCRLPRPDCLSCEPLP